MTPTGRQALQLFGAALVLGVLADILASADFHDARAVSV